MPTKSDIMAPQQNWSGFSILLVICLFDGDSAIFLIEYDYTTPVGVSHSSFINFFYDKMDWRLFLFS